MKNTFTLALAATLFPLAASADCWRDTDYPGGNGAQFHCGTGVVHDTTTGLVVLEDTSCFETLPWLDANEVVSELQSGMCGLEDGSKPGDWRLMDRAEINQHLKGCSDCLLGSAWTSETHPNRADKAWASKPNRKRAAAYSKDKLFEVYPVREPNFVRDITAPTIVEILYDTPGRTDTELTFTVITDEQSECTWQKSHPLPATIYPMTTVDGLEHTATHIYGGGDEGLVFGNYFTCTDGSGNEVTSAEIRLHKPRAHAVSGA